MLGVMLIYLAVLLAPVPLWALGFAAAGALALSMAWRQWKATEATIHLTKTELVTSDGLTLARLSEITGVDRGVLAFKPSQGFLVRTSEPQPRAWSPGLYWRFGRSVGVGGVTQAGQGRFMAETIQMLIAERDGRP
ncbi:MAG: hypothetical protein AAF618_07215 [Pseudomonadota bacterium]